MSLLEELRSEIMQAEGKTETPKRVSVSERENHYRLKGMWREMKEDPLGLPSMEEDDSEPEEVEWPVDYRTQIEFDSDLSERISSLFEDVRNRITLQEGYSIEAFYFGELAYEESPFYTSDDADFRFLVLVTGEERGYPNGRLVDLVVDELRGLDENVTEENIQDVEFVFSDQHPCKIVGVSGNLLTDEPFKYYSDVNSLEEYIDVLVERGDDREELENQEQYEVFFRVDGPDEEPPNEIKVRAEAEMEDFIESVASVDGDYKYEGERLGYEDGSTEVSFWLRIPYEED